MKYLLLIMADTNDADYVTQTSEIQAKDIPKFEKLAAVLHTAKTKHTKYGACHNWQTTESADLDPMTMYEGILTGEEIDYYNEFIPFGEYGVHTIASIRILQVEADRELMKKGK